MRDFAQDKGEGNHLEDQHDERIIRGGEGKDLAG